MRVSTAQIYTQGIKSFGIQQTKLAELQRQISTGVRISRPSDDPAASARILELEQTQKLNEQYQTNINLAENRLNLEETTLTGVDNVLQRIRELALQGNNATQDTLSRSAIAAEIEELQKELVSLANTIDSNGDYLFAGHQSKTQPFTENITGSIAHIDFNGDQGQRFLNISQSRKINTDTSGSDIFMAVASETALNESADSTNTGSGVLAPAHVFDNTNYVADTYQITFDTVSSVPDTLYNVVNSGGITVASGTYTESQDIEFMGIKTSVTGSPDNNDRYTISQGQYKDIFSMVSNLAESLRAGSSGSSSIHDNMAQAIRDIDSSFNKVLEARTSIGGRLNALQNQFDDNAALVLDLQRTLSVIRDTDLAEAISQLSLEQTTLDAAQAVFARITSSSLFNFLR